MLRVLLVLAAVLGTSLVGGLPAPACAQTAERAVQQPEAILQAPLASASPQLAATPAASPAPASQAANADPMVLANQGTELQPRLVITRRLQVPQPLLTTSGAPPVSPCHRVPAPKPVCRAPRVRAVKPSAKHLVHYPVRHVVWHAAPARPAVKKPFRVLTSAASAGAPMYLFVVPVQGGGASPVAIHVSRDAKTDKVDIQIPGSEARALTPTGTGVSVPVLVSATPTPAPAASPPSLAASPQPTSAPSATPTATVPPSPAVPSAPQANRLTARFSPVFLSEHSASGGVDVGPAWVPGVDLAYDADFGDADFGFARFGYANYTFVDDQGAQSQHHRDDFQAEVGGGRNLLLGGQQTGLGLEAWARLVSVGNNLALPLDTPLVTAPTSFFFGPRLVGRSRFDLAPGWSARLEVRLAPYLFATGDDSLAAFVPLYSLGGSAALSYQLLPNVALEAAYRYDLLASYGGGFNHSENGPSLGVGGTF